MSNEMRNAVAYFRVSTERQGESGLGLEAQEEAVHIFMQARQITLARQFTEIESGKKNKRPLLQEAIRFCKENKTLLIIAKLDRLGRSVAFISALMESEIEFVAVDYPQADRLILHILAAFAEYERRQISIRTKAALQAAKRRGVELGKNGKVLAVTNKKASLDFASKLEPVIDAIRTEGFRTIQSITDELNSRNVSTYRAGCKWHKSTVYNLLSKINT
jgi:DNA invertase Pin-like site-specific DNA recombinase